MPAGAHPGSRVDTRISLQVRRFAVVWMAAAIATTLFAAGAGWLTDAYLSDAQQRASALATTRQHTQQLQLAVLRESTDELQWRLRPGLAYSSVIAADLTAVSSARRGLASAAGALGATGSVPAGLGAALAAAARWQAQAAAALAAGRRPGASGDLPGAALSTRLGLLSSTVAPALTTARRRAADHAATAGLVQTVSTVIAVLVLAVGGARLLLRTWRLAVDADSRRERESRWRSQIEGIVSWNNRAKNATTRAQLLGFAQMIPPHAIGAECLDIATGGFPEHQAHGRDRIAIPVDETGNGLYLVVCFADGRGDQLDHHALELAVGHLAALWRTVLRQEDLERAAGHDTLTGLPNRRTFDLELRRRVGLWKRRALGFTLAMIDLDHFKAVNDSFGHPEGDDVLRRAGEAIRDSLRGSDRLFRLGGEEFAVLLETTDERGVQELLERARASVKALGVEPRPGLVLSASVGWAIYPDDADEKGTLVARADAALYQAKNGGRDRVVRSGEDVAAPV